MIQHRNAQTGRVLLIRRGSYRWPDPMEHKGVEAWGMMASEEADWLHRNYLPSEV